MQTMTIIQQDETAQNKNLLSTPLEKKDSSKGTAF